MLSAHVIAVTHEHYDHINGIRVSDLKRLGPALRLTGEQIADSHRPAIPGFTPEQRGLILPMKCAKHCLLAPGIVLVRAPGHTPGSAIIYVLLQDGQEFYFLGDIAWNRQNLVKMTGRPRLVSLIMGEDYSAVAHQLRALLDLMQTPKNGNAAGGVF